MSRFWGGLSDSEEDDDEMDLTTSEEEEEEEEGSDVESGSDEEGGKVTKRDFFDQFSSDEDEDNEKRVVRSVREKRYEAIATSAKTIQNNAKIADWTAVSNEWENMSKLLHKASQLVEREGFPKTFIKAFAELQAAVEAAWTDKDALNKLSPGNKKNLSTLRQKLRKSYVFYEKDLEAYKADPSAFDGPDVPPKPGHEDDDEDFSDDDEDDGFVEKKRRGKKEEEAPAEEAIKPEHVEKKLAEVQAERGRKNVDKKKQLALLRQLFEIADTDLVKVRVLMTIIMTHLDFVTSMVQHLPVEIWKNAMEDLRTLFTMLDANKTIIVREDAVDELSDDEEEGKMIGAGLEAGAPVALPTGPKAKLKAQRRAAAASVESSDFQYVLGSIAAIVERLDDEFFKSLQHADQHTTDYVERLRDEPILYEMIVRTQLYYERLGRFDPLCRAMLRRVEHMYFKNQIVNDKLEVVVHQRLGLSGSPASSSTLMHQLCTFLYKNANERIRTRALLCHVYHHALHGRFYQARDLLLMSHLQETIQLADVQTQILYNRAMAQLGLCAFRHGLIREAQQALADLESSGRIKELLAQGIMTQRFGERNLEQEKLERQRQVPFHMHINLELIECVYLVCSMCIEIPMFAASTFDARKPRLVSKPFRRVLENIERQIFSGPPENTREHITHASKALLQGDWKRCRDLILSIKIWTLMPEKAQVLDMLSRRIQEEGLRTYLFTFSHYYDSMSLEHLATMFDLDVPHTHAIISKMIFHEELHGSLDQVANVLVLHRAEPNRLQHLALQYTDKLAALIDSNERTFDIRSGPQKDERRDTKRGAQAGRSTGQRTQYSGQRDYQRRDRSGYQGGQGGQNAGYRRTASSGGERRKY